MEYQYPQQQHAKQNSMQEPQQMSDQQQQQQIQQQQMVIPQQNMIQQQNIEPVMLGQPINNQQQPQQHQQINIGDQKQDPNIVYPYVNNFPQQGNSREPQVLKCGACGTIVKSNINYYPGLGSYLTCVLLYIFTVFTLAWLPFVCNQCKDVHHTCPNCGNNLGRVSNC